MSCTAGELAALIHGEVVGNADREVCDAAPLATAGASEVSFVAQGTSSRRWKDCQAGTLVIAQSQLSDVKDSAERTWIVVADPQESFQTILLKFRRVCARPARGISPQACVSPSAKIGENCSIGAGAVVGDNVEIGPDCDIYPGVVIGPGCRLAAQVTLYPNAVLYHDVIVGERAIVHANAVIGADGFGYRFAQGRFEKIPQLGHVVLEADVEIGACATVDRGAVGPTVIGAGSKIDNLVMVAHNCRIGRHNVFASQVGIAGSCSTGDYVRMGGQVGVGDHIHLGAGCSIGAKSGLHKDIPAGEMWVGYPATPEAEQKRLVFSLKRVPEMRDEMKELKKQVAALQAQLAALASAHEAPSFRAAG